MDTAPEESSQATVVPPGGGEVIGDAPDRTVLVLSDHEALAATWTRFGPGRDGAELHVHHLHTDLFYVLSGELTIRLGAEGHPVAVPAGRLVRVPPLVIHGFRNASDAEVTYLNLHAPGQRFIDFMRSVREGHEFDWDQHEPPGDGGRPASEAVIGEPVCDVEEIEIAERRGEPGARIALGSGPTELESLYVLAGALDLISGERELRAEAGTWLQVPPGGDHSLSFPGPEPARYLRIRTPASS